MNKEQEIRNMLEYIAGKHHDFRKRCEGVYIVSDGLEPTVSRENYSWDIDFLNKTIIEYAYDESHHNGDHYNCITNNLNWIHLQTGYTKIKYNVKLLVEKEVLRKLQDQLVETRMNDILQGKI